MQVFGGVGIPGIGRIVAAACIFLAARDGWAQQDTYTVIGAPGLVTCDTWLAISSNDTERVIDTKGLAAEQVKAWVAGFLSAYTR